MRSQILRGEKCPQQAVPVTKELPEQKESELELACQKSWLVRTCGGNGYTLEMQGSFPKDHGVKPEKETLRGSEEVPQHRSLGKIIWWVGERGATSLG